MDTIYYLYLIFLIIFFVMHSIGIFFCLNFMRVFLCIDLAIIIIEIILIICYSKKKKYDLIQLAVFLSFVPLIFSVLGFFSVFNTTGLDYLGDAIMSMIFSGVDLIFCIVFSLCSCLIKKDNLDENIKENGNDIRENINPMKEKEDLVNNNSAQG